MYYDENGNCVYEDGESAEDYDDEDDYDEFGNPIEYAPLEEVLKGNGAEYEDEWDEDEFDEEDEHFINKLNGFYRGQNPMMDRLMDTYERQIGFNSPGAQMQAELLYGMECEDEDYS